MGHSFKLIFDGYPYNLSNLALKLSVDLGIHLNRTVIGVDSAKREIQSLMINPFLKQYYGLQMTYRFNDNDPYMNKELKDDYAFLDEDFRYTQQILFSYKDDLSIDESSSFLAPLFKVVSALQSGNNVDSIFIYTGPDKATVIYKKKENSISVNHRIINLFDGNLLKMSEFYILKISKEP